MVRRLHSLLLMLACVFAPVAPALAGMLAEPEACCCADRCPCAPMSECAPAPSAPQRTAPSVGAAAERASPAAKPATRSTARFVFAYLLAAASPAQSAPSLSVSASRTDAMPAAGVALLQAHCSWRV